MLLVEVGLVCRRLLDESLFLAAPSSQVWPILEFSKMSVFRSGEATCVLRHTRVVCLIQLSSSHFGVVTRNFKQKWFLLLVIVAAPTLWETKRWCWPADWIQNMFFIQNTPEMRWNTQTSGKQPALKRAALRPAKHPSNVLQKWDSFPSVLAVRCVYANKQTVVMSALA